MTLFVKAGSVDVDDVGGSGLVVEAQGYAGFFWLAAALGLPAVALSWYLARAPLPRATSLGHG